MRAMKAMFMTSVLFWGAVPLLAQGNPNNITVAPISFDVPNEDIITEAYFYDWWLVQLRADQQISVTMTAQDGLEPLVGLLDPNRTLVERSDDGAPNTTVSLTYTAPEAGEYTIVATRAGNADGTSVGTYTVTVADVTPNTNIDPYREVTFDCEGQEAANALTIEITEDKQEDAPEQFMTASVYGLAGLQPGLRTTVELDFDPYFDQFCIAEGRFREDRLQLPGGDPIAWEAQVPRTNFQNINDLTRIQLNVGALNGTSGTYVIVIDGLAIERGGDRDLLEIGLGPLAQNEAVLVYAVSDKSTRLDSSVARIDPETNAMTTCDDAGSRDCEDVPAIDDFEWYSAEHGTTVSGGRLDGGIRLTPNSPDKQQVLVASFDGRTYGDYSVVIIGQFPERQNN